MSVCVDVVGNVELQAFQIKFSPEAMTSGQKHIERVKGLILFLLLFLVLLDEGLLDVVRYEFIA